MTRTPISEAGTDIKYDADLLAAQAQEHIDKFRKRMKDIAEECLGEIYCNITPYIETDTWTNYREALRLELQHEYMFSNFKQPWATDFRRAVFVENREEISKLIEADMLKRIKSLEDCKQEYDQFRYSPGGDRYQDKVKELDSLKAKHERLLEALTAGGYNSVRETLALMAEGEGKDPRIYQAMARRALRELDSALAKIAKLKSTTSTSSS